MAEESYINGDGAGIRVKMPQKFIDLKDNSESLLQIRNTDVEK